MPDYAQDIIIDHSIRKWGDEMDYLMLVNRFEPLPEGYADTLKLREVQGRLFEAQTAHMLEDMLKAASEDGIMIRVISGYCSDEHKLILKGCEKADNTQEYSEHVTGLAADLGTWDAEDVDQDFNSTAAGRWLCENASDHGFILRYPKFKEHITGVDYEPWHYRYVGTEAAKLITESGICLEEFLHFYSDKYTQC